MTSDINNPLVSHCFLFTMALKGMEPAHNPQEGAKSSKGAHLSLLHQRQNMKGNESTVQGKTTYTNIKIKSFNPPPKKKKHKNTNSRLNRAVWTVFGNCAHLIFTPLGGGGARASMARCLWLTHSGHYMSTIDQETPPAKDRRPKHCRTEFRNETWLYLLPISLGTRCLVNPIVRIFGTSIRLYSLQKSSSSSVSAIMWSSFS